MELPRHFYFGLAFLSVSLPWVLGDCADLDLGMESRTISDNKITASSELNANTSAKNGRLNYTAGSSWCAFTSDSNPYLQIDLKTLHIICAVSTQGNSQGDQWVETYTLQSSKDGKTWISYKKDGQVKTFTGNNDSNTENKNIVNGVLTRWLRFVGKTNHDRFCMRTEVFGVRLKPENLAGGKNTSQSSTYSDHLASGESYKAVDGNADQDFNNGHCTHTWPDNPSWWRVDLGSNHVPVSEVRIVNRMGYGSRSKDYKLTFGNDPDVLSNPECVGLYTFDNFIASAVCYNNPMRTGTYLGIITTKREFFTLCEVEVYSRENLAFRKTTNQSTNYSNFSISSNAVDGNSNTTWGGHSCTKTNVETKPWWTVDLGQVEPVIEIYIVNRGDCCGWRLNPFEIRVGTNSSNGGVTNPKCGDGGYSVPQGQGAPFFCRPILYGRYVTIIITKSGKFPLTLCEVEVYSARRACQIQRVGVASSYAYPNESFSASSSVVGNEPFNGRLNGQGAWSPLTDKFVNDFLQINLQYEFYICAVATQGNPSADHWTKKYKLILSIDNTKWTTYQESGTNKIFNANNGRNDIVKHNLVEIARARFVRFQPIEFSTRKALRVELYGVTKPPVPSKAPINFTVTSVSSTSIFASWELAPEDSKTERITGFKLFYKKKGSGDSAKILIINSGSTLVKNVAGLNKFTEYELQVLSFNYAGDGPKSSVKVDRTKEDVPSHAPVSFTVKVRSSSSIVASWQLPPAVSRNGKVTGFKLFYRKKDSGDSMNILIINFNSGSKITTSVTGLNIFTEYEFQVLAFTSVGDGPKSSFKYKRTNEDAPSEAPIGFKVEAISPTIIYASWDLPPAESRNGIIAGFKLFYKKKEFNDPPIMINIKDGDIRSMTVLGLAKNTGYKFQVLAYTSAGDGPKSSVKVERTKEDVPSQAPVSFTVKVRSSSSIVASWQLPPADSRNGKVTGFKLFYRKKDSGDLMNILIINSGSKLATNVTGLSIFTEYEFQVLAFTSVGDGPKSSVKFKRTDEDVPSQAPIGFKVYAISSTTIDASWDLPPADSRNGIIAGFKLFYRKKEYNDPLTMINIKDGDMRSKTVPGLAKNAEYEFQVLAYTSAGDGPKSSVKVERTKEDGISLKGFLTLGFSIAGSVFIAVLVVFGVRYCKKRKTRPIKRFEKSIEVLDHWEISPIRIEFVEELGHGSFGKVHKAKLKDDLEYFKVGEVSVYTTNRKQKIVAVKQLDENANEQQENEFLDEIDCLKSAGKHPNVLSFIGSWTTTKPFLLLIEYIPHGNLLHWLQRKRRQMNGYTKTATKENRLYENIETERTTTDQGGVTHENKAEVLGENGDSSTILGVEDQEQATSDGIDQCEIAMVVFSSSSQRHGASAKTTDDECDDDCESFDPSDLMSFAWQIARGMSYLSSKDIVHRDLAARNIFVGHGKKLKIGDFGLMRKLYHEMDEVNAQKKLRIKWMAPESIYEQIFTCKSDVWSFGVVMWEIGTLGGSPYPLLNNTDLMKLLKTDYRMEKPDLCSENFYSLMMDCWKQDPDERPSFQELFGRVDQIILRDVEYFDFDQVDESKDYYQVQE